MTPNQLQLAIGQCVQQALTSGQTNPIAVFGILELAKLDLHAHILKIQEQQASNIIQAKRMPEGGG